jgi:hypothetical protein
MWSSVSEFTGRPIKATIKKDVSQILVEHNGSHMFMNFMDSDSLRMFVANLACQCSELVTSEELADKIIDEHSEQESMPLP